MKKLSLVLLMVFCAACQHTWCRHDSVLNASQFELNTGNPTRIAVGYVAPYGQLHSEEQGWSKHRGWFYLTHVPRGFVAERFYTIDQFTARYRDTRTYDMRHR